MENSVSSGYVTEKLIQPLLAGSVPIYYGANDVDRVRGSIQHTLSIQPTLKTYPLNTPFNSTYPFNPPSQPTHSTHPLNTPTQYNQPSQYTPSVHPLNTPSYTSSLFFLITLSHITVSLLHRSLLHHSPLDRRPIALKTTKCTTQWGA